MKVETGSPNDVLAKLDNFHHNFKLKFIDDPVTTVCFPVLPHRQIFEYESRVDICRRVLTQKFPHNVANMVWFDFDPTTDTVDPDAKLPVGNFVISAQSGIGKTNAAFAILDGFARWRRKSNEVWTESPSYDMFDVVYINLKSECGAQVENDNASEDEVHFLKEFLRKKILTGECVRPKDIKTYLEMFSAKHGLDESAIVYTESDGSTKWVNVITEIDQTNRKPRGLVLVVDEAFKTLNDARRSDIRDLYFSVYNTWRTKGVRVVLIGQEVSKIGDFLGRDGLGNISDVLEKSTLIIGGQKESDDLRRAIVAGCNEEEVDRLDWLDCGGPQKINDIVSTKKLPYTFGPVIVRPSLYGMVCHPIRCHIRPEDLSYVDPKKCKAEWWGPGT
jgi:hypothetical protein